jgi:transposase
MRCSQDLRKRVLAFVQGGGSKAEAARRFQVGRASVYRWTKGRAGLTSRRPGPTGPRRLDWAALRAHVQQQPDATQQERAHHFGVSRHCIWYGLQRLQVSWKKNSGVQRAR